MKSFIFMFAVLFIPAFCMGTETHAPACPAQSGVDSFDAWLTLISRGRFEAATKKIDEWTKAPGCACASSSSLCLEIKTSDGSKETVSPQQMSVLVSQAASWEAAGRKKCDPLSGGDELGAMARKFCLERHAEAMDGIDDALAKKLLPGALKADAERMAKGESFEEAPTEEGGPNWVSHEKTTLQERSELRAKKVADEVCQLRTELSAIEKRLENMKRETKFIPGEYGERLRRQQKLREDVVKAIERGTKLFLQIMKRELDPGVDCVKSE